MRGSVKKTTNKKGEVSWYYVADIGTDQNGKRKQKKKRGFKTKEEAEKALTELLSKLDKGIFVDSKNMTVAEYLRFWLEQYTKNKVKNRTYDSYESVVKIHLIPNLGSTKLDKLTPTQIQQYYTRCINETELSGTSILYNHKILKQALNQAIKWELIVRNPCNAVDPPKKNDTDFSILDEIELEILLNHIKDKAIYLPILIAITTGMRRGEIVGLKWDNVDFQNKVLYVKQTLQRIDKKLVLTTPKTKKANRPIAITDSLLEILKEVRKKQINNRIELKEKYQNDNFVCCWDDGSPLRPGYLTDTFIKIRNKLGLKVRFHDLRHSHATFLLKMGIHPKIVQERLGHSQISITMDTYSHVLPNMQKEAVEKMDKLINIEPKKTE